MGEASSLDFLLAFAEWMDLGLTGVGLVLGALIYRRRALVTDLLWWMRERARHEGLMTVVRAVAPSESASLEEALKKLETHWGRPLTDLDRYVAQSLWEGLHRRGDGSS